MRMTVQRVLSVTLSHLLGPLILAGLVGGCGANRAGSIEQRQMTLQGDYRTLSEDLNDTRGRLADTRATMEDLQRQVNALNAALEEKNSRTGEGAAMDGQQLQEFNARMTSIEEELKAQAALLQVREEELRLLRDTVLQTGKGSGRRTAVSDKKPGGGVAMATDPARGVTLGPREDHL